MAKHDMYLPNSRLFQFLNIYTHKHANAPILTYTDVFQHQLHKSCKLDANFASSQRCSKVSLLIGYFYYCYYYYYHYYYYYYYYYYYFHLFRCYNMPLGIRCVRIFIWPLKYFANDQFSMVWFYLPPQACVSEALYYLNLSFRNKTLISTN